MRGADRHGKRSVVYIEGIRCMVLPFVRSVKKLAGRIERRAVSQKIGERFAWLDILFANPGISERRSGPVAARHLVYPLIGTRTIRRCDVEGPTPYPRRSQ